MIVMKFGGTSVGGAEQIAQVAEIVERVREGSLRYSTPTEGLSPQGEPIQTAVVVSAMSGVTDALVTAAKAADLSIFQIVNARSRYVQAPDKIE